MPFACGTSGSAAPPWLIPTSALRSLVSRSVKIASWRIIELGGLLDRVARSQRAIGRDVERQPIEVGALTDASRIDADRDAADGREDRVDRNHADRRLGTLVVGGRDIAATPTDGEGHLEARAIGEMADLELGVHDLEFRRYVDVGSRHDGGAVLEDARLDLTRVAVQHGDEALEVENDVGDVLADALDRRELVLHALDLHRGDSGALDTREQHAAQGVPVGVAKAALEGLDDERAVGIGHVLLSDPRKLVVQHYSHPDLRSDGGARGAV